MIFQEVVELRHDLLQIRDLIALIVMVYSRIDKIAHAMSLEVFFKFYERCLAIPIIFFSEFIMLKKDINGLLIVSFFWEADRNYAVTIKNGTLQIEVRFFVSF